jgi:hypothetical protein
MKNRSIYMYLDPGVGFIAARILKIIKQSNETIPPKPSFHIANINPESPVPQTTKVIIL